MARLIADPVFVLPEQRDALEQLVRTHSTPQQLAMRARIILQADEGVGVRERARELGAWPKTVRYWRKRWRRDTNQGGNRRAGCGAGEDEPPERPRKLKIKLADGKERGIQHMMATTFMGMGGKPLSAAQFVERLHGKLPAVAL